MTEIYEVTGKYQLMHDCGCPHCDYVGQRTVSICQEIECEPDEIKTRLRRFEREIESDCDDNSYLKWLERPEAEHVRTLGEDVRMMRLGAPTLFDVRAL